MKARELVGPVDGALHLMEDISVEGDYVISGGNRIESLLLRLRETDEKIPSKRYAKINLGQGSVDVIRHPSAPEANLIVESPITDHVTIKAKTDLNNVVLLFPEQKRFDYRIVLVGDIQSGKEKKVSTGNFLIPVEGKEILLFSNGLEINTNLRNSSVSNDVKWTMDLSGNRPPIRSRTHSRVQQFESESDQEAKILIAIGKSGRVSLAEIKSCTSTEYGESCREVALKLQFWPRIQNWQIVPTEALIPFTYKAKKEKK